MRTALLHHMDAENGEGLDAFMAEAIRTHRADLTPADRSPR
jgi:hypothetical protein